MRGRIEQDQPLPIKIDSAFTTYRLLPNSQPIEPKKIKSPLALQNELEIQIVLNFY